MGSLFKNGHHGWALFLGHLVLEKLLKAIYVKNVNVNIPFTHDLAKLSEKAGLLLTEDQKDLLDEVTTFNIPSPLTGEVLRFWNNEVLQNTNEVLAAIRENCLYHPPLNPLPSREGK